MTSVVWTQSALNELASLWMAANSSDRTLITRSCHIIDERLAKDAGSEGESRSLGLRIMFVSPLAVTFHYDSQLDQATVARVRLSTKRPRT